MNLSDWEQTSRCGKKCPLPRVTGVQRVGGGKVRPGVRGTRVKGMANILQTEMRWSTSDAIYLRQHPFGKSDVHRTLSPVSGGSDVCRYILKSLISRRLFPDKEHQFLCQVVKS